MSTITLGGNTYTLVPFPVAPGLSDIAIGMNDAIAVVASPYVPSQVQTQQWPGADAWDLELTVPPLSNAHAADWEGFLAALQGALNVFQAGDPRRQHPLGAARGVPVAAAGNVQNAAQLLTGGWVAGTANQLLRGDLLQVGYRLHRVTAACSSDASGNMTIPVWPVLREVPATGASIVLNNPRGVFRLAQNRRQSQASRTRLTTLSFKAAEVR